MGVYGYMKNSKWNGKNVLVVGDSLTSDGRWQERFSDLTGANIETHAYGGLGIVEIIDGKTASADKSVCYDPITGTGFEFGPLTKEKIGWADLVILLMGYNERHIEYGERGDIYPEKQTLHGKYAYALKKIYSFIDQSGNYNCRILIVCPHCIGRYDWINADGYEEFPEGSGRSLETMAEAIKDVAAYHNLPCYDAWHNSGINRFTWKYFANSPVALNPEYDPQKEYTAPYPMYADQAHLNAAGYARLGECIAAAAELV